VFIALFWTLLAAVEFRYSPLVLWITDMSVPDPYYVLPVIMGVSMWIQSKLSPTPADPIQAKVMQIMPIAFSIFFFFFPAGLVLYSLCNNILSIAQQWQITRMYENKAEEANKDKNKKKTKNDPEPAKENLQLTAPVENAEADTAPVEAASAVSVDKNEKPQIKQTVASGRNRAPVKPKSNPVAKKTKRK